MKINGRVNTRLFELEHILNLLLVLNETLQAIHKFSSLNSGIGGNKSLKEKMGGKVVNGLYVSEKTTIRKRMGGKVVNGLCQRENCSCY